MIVDYVVYINVLMSLGGVRNMPKLHHQRWWDFLANHLTVHLGQGWTNMPPVWATKTGIATIKHVDVSHETLRLNQTHMGI